MADFDNFSTHESIPPLLSNEVQLKIPNFKARYINAQSANTSNVIHSDWKYLDNFTFRLMVFPSCASKNSTSADSVGAFVEVQRRPDWPKNWAYYGVHYNIIILNLKNPRKSIYKQDVFTFTRNEIDRGWHEITTHGQLDDEGFLTDPDGDLYIRSGVYLHTAEYDLDTREHDYDSRSATGYVGLLNHGATCYMNALIQGLYHIGRFRSSVFLLNFESENSIGSKSKSIVSKLLSSSCNKMVLDGKAAVDSDDPAGVNYSIDDLDDKDARELLLEEEKEKSKIPSASFALQNLFYKLYFSRDAPPCRELIKSFGWDAIDAFTQHDSHELLKLLLSKVEEQMKGTPSEGSVKDLFGGEMETYIECIDIDYKSVRKESFEDIQLDVHGFSNIYDSLKQAIEPEILEGENMYEAEGHGKQRARKGIRFLKFPKVCIFLLKRFTFNIQCMDTVKLNSRFEFYKEIDLTPFLASPANDSREEYVLHAVSVHQGGMNSGHYYAFCRPNLHEDTNLKTGGNTTGNNLRPNGVISPADNNNSNDEADSCDGLEYIGDNWGGWLKFDDEKVCKVSEYSAIEDNFGGEIPECYNYLLENKRINRYTTGSNSGFKFKSYNAYILVYVKKSELNNILYPCDPRKVNPEVVSRCQMQERVVSIRQQIRQRLSKFIKVGVFFKSNFVNYAFLDQPFINWQEPGLTMKFERSEILGDVLLKLSKVIAGYDPEDNVELCKLNYDISNFHILGLSTDVNRFEHLSQFDFENIEQRDKYTPVFRGVASEIINKLIRRVNLNLLDPYDPTIYLLHLPVKEDTFKLYYDPTGSKFPSCNVVMLVVKYFDIFAKIPSQDNLICLDLIYVDANYKPLHLEFNILERLLELMKDGKITPHRTEEITDIVNKYRTALANHKDPHFDPSNSAVKNKIYHELHKTLEHRKLSLCCYVETNGKCEPLSLKRVFLEHKIYTGDLLVINFLPSEDMRLMWESTSFHSKEDFEITQEYQNDSESTTGNKELDGDNKSVISDIVRCEFDNENFAQNLTELPPGKGGNIVPTPPQLPKFPIFDFPSFLDLISNKVSVTFKLYDPLQTLSLPINCSGQLISSIDNNKVQNINIEDANNTCNPSFSSSLSDLSDDDFYRCSLLKLIPLITRSFELDLRCPVKKALKYVCWHLKLDASRMLLYPKPPLLCPGTCESFSVDHFFHRDSSLCYEQVTLSELFKILCAYQGANFSKSPTATLHLCILPWHYSKILCFTPFDKCPLDTGDRVFVAQILNDKVQVTQSLLSKVNIKECVNVGQLLDKITGDRDNWALVREENFSVKHWDNEALLSELVQFSPNSSLKNVFAVPLRVEPAISASDKEMIQRDELFPLTIVHQTPDRDTFGFPFMVLIKPGENVAAVKAKIRDKICISQKEWVRWSFTQYDGTTRTWKANDDFLDLSNPNICFLAEHQMPYQKLRGQSIMKLA